MTVTQAFELGAHARKGEKGPLVVYARAITRTEEGDNGEETEREIHFMKDYTVSTLSKLTVRRSSITKKLDLHTTLVERISHTETVLKVTAAHVRYRSDRPFTPSESVPSAIAQGSLFSIH